MALKTGRNDPCWCGSGKKFKKCHLGRDHERPLPVQALGSELNRFFKGGECLHPEASRATCGKVIGAHTIQRKGALAQIVDHSRHCLTLFSHRAFIGGTPQRCGWREASIFSGFCYDHDAVTFAPVESIPFIGTTQQTFLLAYRAECHEFYQKRASDRSQEPMRSLLDRGQSREAQAAIQEYYNAQGAEVRAGLEFSRRQKARMDAELLAGAFDGWDRLFVRFEGPISVVSAGAPSPENSLPRWRPQTFCYDDPKHPPDYQGGIIERIYVTVVSSDGGGAVVLTWRRGLAQFECFITELKRLRRDVLPGVLVQMMFAYIENTYFSAEWWDSLGENHREHIRWLAGIEPYCSTPFEYMENLPVPWRILSLSENWDVEDEKQS